MADAKCIFAKARCRMQAGPFHSILLVRYGEGDDDAGTAVGTVRELDTAAKIMARHDHYEFQARVARLLRVEVRGKAFALIPDGEARYILIVSEPHENVPFAVFY